MFENENTIRNNYYAMTINWLWQWLFEVLILMIIMIIIAKKSRIEWNIM